MATKKPIWLRRPLPGGGSFSKVKKILFKKNLCTVCVEASCPNIGECWGNGTMTIMILGKNCTRKCKFCNVTSLIPLEPNPQEPKLVSETLKELNIKYAVITSVTRDDLPDGGAEHWAQVIKEVKSEGIKVEALIPDFNGDLNSINKVLNANPDILGHNLETVRRISPLIRSNADYDRSLELLKYSTSSGAITKSSLLLGVGETDEEVFESMMDIRNSGVSIITLGQYLQPSSSHIKVKRFVTPDQFKIFSNYGYEIGFSGVESAPLVRSSYHAEIHGLKLSSK
jgi:lipoyl synthase